MNVSIIIVNYNTFQLTLSCIRSVYLHTSGVSFEIILVDNNSSECDANQFKTYFPDIILIKNPTNAGFAMGNNIGIEKANGEYILLLNSDTELVNDAISIAFRKMQKNPAIGALSGKLIYPEGTIQAVTGRFPSIQAALRDLFRITGMMSSRKKAETLLGDFWDYSKPVEADWIWGTFFMIPAKIIYQFPNRSLHADFFMYVEDMQWCYYLKNILGFKVLYDPEPLIIHHLSGSTTYKNYEKIFRTKVLPNEYRFICLTKGRLYAWAYYGIKALYLISLRKREKVKEGLFYINFIKEQIR